MRRFLVGACCVIVGLQFVAAVVLVIGLAVVAAVGGVRVPTVWHDDRPAYYSELPTAVSPTVQIASWDAPADPVSPAKIDPRVESILRYREEVGSPLAGTILEGDSESPEAQREISSILAEVSARETAGVPANVAEREPAAAATEHVSCPDQPASPLAVAVEHLYLQANQHESHSEYERADRLRDLARQLRTEFGLNGKGSEPAAPPALPPQEPAPPENPAEFPAADADAAESVIPPL